MLPDLRFRLRALFKPASADEDLADELRFHIERQAEKYQQAGLPPAEARRRAALNFGGSEQIKEECRDARGVALADALARDVRHAARSLRKSPGFTAAVVVS